MDAPGRREDGLLIIQKHMTRLLWFSHKMDHPLAFGQVKHIQSYLVGPDFQAGMDADPTVPYQHSVDLHKKLVEMGVKTELITVEGGLHGKFEKEKNSEINKKIANFLLDLGLGSK